MHLDEIRRLSLKESEYINQFNLIYAKGRARQVFAFSYDRMGRANNLIGRNLHRQLSIGLLRPQVLHWQQSICFLEEANST